MDVAIPNRHDGYNTITEKLQEYTDLKEELTRIWQPNAVCTVSLVLATSGIIPQIRTSVRSCWVFAVLDTGVLISP